MVKTILGVLSLLVMSSCSTVVKENTAQPDSRGRGRRESKLARGGTHGRYRP